MSNTMFAIWIGLSAGILLLFLYAAFLNLRRRQSPGAELGDLMNSFLPVNVEVLSEVIESGTATAICKRPLAGKNC